MAVSEVVNCPPADDISPWSTQASHQPRGDLANQGIVAAGAHDTQRKYGGSGRVAGHRTAQRMQTAVKLLTVEDRYRE